MMSDESHLPEYVDSHAASQLLGTKQAKLFYHADRGEIEAVGERRERRYKVADILQVKARLASKKRRPAPVLIDWLSPADIPAILRLDQIVYDEMYLAEMERYRQWSEKNGQLAMAAFDKNDRQIMLAYIACLPLDESVILQILRGEREEIDITQDEIQSYEQPGAYTLLANSAVVHPDHPYLLRRVLQGMIDAWIDRYPERYVTRVYAQSVSERGDMLVQHFFMQPRYDLASNAYMIDMARPGVAKMVRWFQSALKEKAPLPPALQIDYEAPQRPTLPIAPPVSAVLPTPAQPKPRAPRGAQTTALVPEALPPGTLTLQQFADELGMSRSALREYKHTALPKLNRPKEHARYFTLAEQEAVRQKRGK